MTMLRLTRTQRAIVADKFPDLANLFAGGFVIGPFLGAGAPSLWLFIVGLVTWLVFMGTAFLFAEDAS